MQKVSGSDVVGEKVRIMWSSVMIISDIYQIFSMLGCVGKSGSLNDCYYKAN